MKGCQLQASELGILAALNRASALEVEVISISISPQREGGVWWEEHMPTYICLLTIRVHVVYMGTRSFRENIQFFKIWMFPKIVGFFPQIIH